MELVGLDRRPGHPNLSSKDKRWQERMETWRIAERYLNKFNLGQCDVETIIVLASAKGFWSIWMTVFEPHQNVISGLIQGYPGTRLEAFAM